MRKFLLLGLFILVLCGGCSFNAEHLNKVNTTLAERSRENDDAAYLVGLKQRAIIQYTQNKLQTAELTNETASLAITNFSAATNALNGASNANEIAIDFVQRNVGINGLPIQNQEPIVEQLLSSNLYLRQNGQAIENAKIKEEVEWRAEKQKYEAKLLDYGTQFENDRNQKIAWWTRFGIIAAILIIGPILLFIFVPPLAGAVVAIFPKLLGWIGVVGKKVFSNTVKGIGETRNVLQVQAETAQTKNVPEPTYTASEALSLIDKNLYQNTADSHQKLIDATRATVNV